MAKAISLILIVLLLALPATALATDVPSFPTCSNPEGVLKVSYNSGTHGIVGNPGEFSGEDRVYEVDATRTLQCFCSTDGNGIQTNWWRVSSLTQDQIQELKNLGWVFIPSGEPWGLSDDPFMAINNNYSCKSGGNSGSSSSNGQITSTSASTSTSSSPAVLGLAQTGDIQEILVLFVLTVVSASLWIVSKIKKV